MKELKTYIRERAAQVGNDVSDKQVEEIIEAARRIASVIGGSPTAAISFLCDIGFSVPKFNASECGRKLRELIIRGL